MTGIIENLHTQVQGLVAEVNAIKAHLASLAQPATIATPAASVDPFAGFGVATPAAAPAAPVQVTDEMVMKLVSDNVANEAVKAQMQAVLQQMGIARLPDTRPDQLPELYQRLLAVVQAAGALPNGGMVAAGGMGII